jgi:hypothetical protein
VRARLKFRVGRIVYVAISHDGTIMEFASPKDWRAARVDSELDKFALPRASELRYNWVWVWQMCVPKSVAACTTLQHVLQAGRSSSA